MGPLNEICAIFSYNTLGGNRIPCQGLFFMRAASGTSELFRTPHVLLPRVQSKRILALSRHHFSPEMAAYTNGIVVSEHILFLSLVQANIFFTFRKITASE